MIHGSPWEVHGHQGIIHGNPRKADGVQGIIHGVQEIVPLLP